MKKSACAVLLVSLLFGLGSAVLAGAIQDVRIETEEDEKDNTIFKLVNRGDRPILAKVQYDKTCTGVANTRKPTVRDYYVAPKQSIQLAKTWAQTTCEREYRILKAEYR